jgi:hypothetical protein
MWKIEVIHVQTLQKMWKIEVVHENHTNPSKNVEN